MDASQQTDAAADSSPTAPAPQWQTPDSAVEPAESGEDPGVAVPEPVSEPQPPTDTESADGADLLDVVAAERDTYLADLQRVQAEFANFRRQATKRQTDTIEHAASALVNKLLPVLDACDAALLQGAADVEPIQASLLETLRKEGLDVLSEAGEPFDPERHEAVMHDEGGAGEPTVAEIMRPGYVWNGRVLRPAMVRVAG